MAYADDISALGASHLYEFDGNANDSIGTSNGSNSGAGFAGTAICEDAGNSMITNATSDRVTLPSASTITGSTNRKAVAGWFMPTAVQQPPCRIYGEGTTGASFAFLLGFGNSLLYEFNTGSDVIQIFGDTGLVSNRAYHLCMIFEGNGFANECRAYLDGVKQTDSFATAPNLASLPSRTPAEFGDPVGSSAVGGTSLLLVAPVNGNYNYWSFFTGASAVLTDSEVRQELFEKGALPDTTITSGSQSAMQTQLTALASSVRPNKPLCIRVEAVSGNGNVTLTADNVTFDALASIHVQYMGTGTLTWVNTNGSNASIGSTPNGGTILFQTPRTLTINSLIAGSEVRVYQAGTTTEIGGVESSGTSFSLVISASSVDVRILSTAYQIKAFKGVSMASDVTLVAGQVVDRQFENP